MDIRNILDSTGSPHKKPTRGKSVSPEPSGVQSAATTTTNTEGATTVNHDPARASTPTKGATTRRKRAADLDAMPEEEVTGQQSQLSSPRRTVRIMPQDTRPSTLPRIDHFINGISSRDSGHGQPLPSLAAQMQQTAAAIPVPLRAATVGSNYPVYPIAYQHPQSAYSSLSNSPVDSPGTSSSADARRHAHSMSEQKRRQNINDGFEALRAIIPSCRGGNDSKAVVLRKGIQFVL